MLDERRTSGLAGSDAAYGLGVGIGQLLNHYPLLKGVAGSVICAILWSFAAEWYSNARGIEAFTALALGVFLALSSFALLINKDGSARSLAVMFFWVLWGLLGVGVYGLGTSLLEDSSIGFKIALLIAFALTWFGGLLAIARLCERLPRWLGRTLSVLVYLAAIWVVLSIISVAVISRGMGDGHKFYTWKRRLMVR